MHLLAREQITSDPTRLTHPPLPPQWNNVHFATLLSWAVSNISEDS